MHPPQTCHVPTTNPPHAYRPRTPTQADSGKRTCRHLLHEGCSLLLQQHNNSCPVCRAEFGAFQVVPLVNDEPRAWFRCVDFEGNGRLTREEVTEVLASHFPLDRSKLEVTMAAEGR